MRRGGVRPVGDASLELDPASSVASVPPDTDGDDDPDAWIDRFAWVVAGVLMLILFGLMVMLALN